MRNCVAAITVALLAAACAPQGDFGRPAPSVIHDTVVPELGRGMAVLRGEPASFFHFTDDEKRLRRQAYGLVLPARGSETLERALAELQFARIWPPHVPAVDPRNYYASLAGEPFASSEGRLNAVIDDIMADKARLDLFRPTAQAVYLADLDRLEAARGTIDPASGQLHQVFARVEENRRLIDWVRLSLLRRLAAYAFAIDRLAVETPSRRLWIARAALAKLDARIGEPHGMVVWSQSVPIPPLPPGVAPMEIIPSPGQAPRK